MRTYGKPTREDAIPDLSPPVILQRGVGELGIDLSLAQLELFQRYYLELREWNARVNLTSVTEWGEVQRRHYLDSLSVASVLPQRFLGSGRFVDIGSGGGFPGVPLQIAFPETRVTLIEATAKKSDFLRHLKASLGLEGLEILNERAETLGHHPQLRERFDVALVRSISKMAVISELALPFCRVGGMVAAHKSLDVAGEVEAATRAIELTGGALAEVREVSVSDLSPRSLVVVNKVSRTPPNYPRRPGIPSKRPL